MTVDLGSAGILAKITAVDESCGRFFIEFRDGKVGWFDRTDAQLEVGDVLLIVDSGNNQQVQRLPPTAWPEELWVGVVKIKLDDITVIDSSGRFRTVPTNNEPPYECGNTVQAGDVQGVKRVLSKKSIRYVDVPEVEESSIDQFRWSSPENDESVMTFDDFGGLKEVVDRARELIEVPLKSRDALSKIGARSVKGILFTGPPGTGKTMLARIIASQSCAEFYEISGPAIFSKWYGQSEELLRKIFDAASANDRAIIFFDEIDSVAAQRDDQSHEASKRVVAQLLTLMDGFKSDTNVVVIAATNRPQDLDVALRRPGRFDWEIEFPYPDRQDREDILRKAARRLKTASSLPHASAAEESAGWSAAELAAIWTEAALLAVADGRCEIDEEDYIGGFERVARYRNRTESTKGKTRK